MLSNSGYSSHESSESELEIPVISNNNFSNRFFEVVSKIVTREGLAQSITIYPKETLSNSISLEECLETLKPLLLGIFQFKFEHPPKSNCLLKLTAQFNINAEKIIIDTETKEQSSSEEEYQIRIPKPIVIQETVSIGSQVDKLLQDIHVQFLENNNRGSGYVFKSMKSCNLTLAYAEIRSKPGRENYIRKRKLNPRVGNYIPLPGNKKVNYIINPKNEDDRCFEWCLKIHRWHTQLKSCSGKGNVKNYNQFTSYSGKYFDTRFRGWIWKNDNKSIKFPVKSEDLDFFEELNPDYSINVYSYTPLNSNKDASKIRFNKKPIRVSKHCHGRQNQVDLIRINDSDNNYHYALITDFNAFMRSGFSGEENHKHKRFYCRYDLTSFPSQKELEHHINNFCLKQEVALSFPDEDINELEFKKFHAKLQTPYYIVADLESINKEVLGQCSVCKRDITELDKEICDAECRLPHDDFLICKDCHPSMHWQVNDETECIEYYSKDVKFEFIHPEVKPSKTKNLYEQRANSWAFYVVNTFDYTKNHKIKLDFIMDENDYEDLGTRFVQELMDAGKEIMLEIKTTNKKMIITEEDQKQIEAATHCSICGYALAGHIVNDEHDNNKHGERRINSIQIFKEIKENAYKYGTDRKEFFLTLEYIAFRTKYGIEDNRKLEVTEEMDEMQAHDMRIKIEEYKVLYKAFTDKKYSYHSVRDHCHFTGKFRGVAHNCCNLHFNYSKFKIPVFFHNMRGYDSHFVFQWLHKKSASMNFGKDDYLKKLNVIPQNTEKFISFSFDNFKFVDSYGFFGNKLSKLVDGLMGRDEKLQEKIDKYKALLLEIGNRIIKRGLVLNDPENELDQNSYAHINREYTECVNKQNNILNRGIKNFPFINQEYQRDLGPEGFINPEDEKEALILLMEKGSWPYEYFTHIEQYSEEQLPPIEAYKLRVAKINETEWDYKTITEEDYEKEQRKFKLFNMKTIRDAHDLYLKVDVIALADVLESRRKAMLDAFGLDYMWYLSLPGYAWDVMLSKGYTNLKTKEKERIRLEVFHEEQQDMYLMIEKGIRGGICNISHRLAEANNKYLNPDEYYKKKHPVKKEEEMVIDNNDDDSDESSYLWYIDANQLYSWAMTQYLPFNKFRWKSSLKDIFPALADETDMEAVTEKIATLHDESDIGYIFMVDLEYPDKLHDEHSDYPLAPEPLIINEEELSPFQKKLKSKEVLDLKPMKVSKLYTTLKDKKDYIIHYRNLKLYLRQGMKLKSVKKILQFQQRPWIKDFIDFCVNKRKDAKTDWDKDMYKLMCNAVYGKTMECETNRISFEIVSNSKRYEHLVRDPFYKNTIPIAHNTDLVGVCMERSTAQLTKPKATGFAVLDLSKLLMYEFYYDKLRSEYDHKHTKLCMTDTDSLELLIKTDDLYQDLLKPNSILASALDFSNYTHPINVGVNIIKKSWSQRYMIYLEMLMTAIRRNGGDVLVHELNEEEDLFCTTGIDKIPTLTPPTKDDDYTFPPTVLLSGHNKHNNKVCGVFKDEWGGWLISHFVGNKAKSYSNIDETSKETKKLKGVPKEVLKRRLKHQNYVDVINNPDQIITQTFTKLGSQKHAIYFYQKTMIALCAYDDKRYILHDNIHTRAFGHYLNNYYTALNQFTNLHVIKEESSSDNNQIKDKLIQEYDNIIMDTDDNDYIYNVMPKLESGLNSTVYI